MHHAVINRLKLSKPFDADLLASISSELRPALADRDGFVGLHIVQVAELEVVLVVLFSSKQALDEISSAVAGPWFAKNVRPYLDGPVNREVGAILWSSDQNLL